MEVKQQGGNPYIALDAFSISIAQHITTPCVHHLDIKRQNYKPTHAFVKALGLVVVNKPGIPNPSLRAHEKSRTNQQ